MAARILDGRREAEKILRRLKTGVSRRQKKITLATVLVGRRFDSALYVRLKTAAAARIGMATELHRLPTSATQRRLEKLLDHLSRRRDIDGILLQLPLPKGMDTARVVARIKASKDADGLRPRLKVQPPTIAAVLHLVRLARPPARAAAVILGRPGVFSYRLAQCFRLRYPGCRVTTMSARHHFPSDTKNFDLVITALGRGPRLTGTDIKPGAIVIDVGIRRLRGKTVGDADLSIRGVAAAVSPVPGGVGPLTVAYLLYNTYRLALSSRR